MTEPPPTNPGVKLCEVLASARTVPPGFMPAATERVPFAVAGNSANAACGIVYVPKFPATGQVTLTLFVVEPAVVDAEAVITTKSNPAPSQLIVSGIARSIEVRELQFVTVKAEGSVAEVLNGAIWVPPLPVSV